MTRYICGTCGARFQTEQTPKGCPVCWSDKISVTSREATRREKIKTAMQICNEEVPIILDLRQQLKAHTKEYKAARLQLKNFSRGGYVEENDIPRIRK